MKILTNYTDKYEKISKITVPRIDHYCKKHGFTYSYEKLPEVCERPHSWYKITTLLDHLKDNDYILWIDSDAIILNMDFDPRIYLDSKYNFYLTTDFGGINFGICMFKCDEYTKMILEEIWSRYPEFIDHGWWEQAALIRVLRENFMNVQSKVKQLPGKIFNAYEHKHPRPCYPNGLYYPQGEVCKETFIFHTAGLEHKLREELIEKHDKLNAIGD